MGLFISIASFVLSVVIIYYVVRKATDAEEQTKLLREILAASQPAPEPSAIVKLTQERAETKTEAEYLAEARKKYSGE